MRGTKQITVPQRIRQQVGALEFLRWLYKKADDAADEYRKQRGVPLCVEGCGLCCLQTPAVTETEARYVVSLFPSLSPTVQRKIQKNLEEWHKPDVVRVPFSKDVQHNPALEEGTGSGFDLDMQAAAKAVCPFLDRQTRQCMVYQARPLPCRLMSLTRVPPDECARPVTAHETKTRRGYLSVLSVPGQNLRLAIKFWWEKVREVHVTETVGWLPNLFARLYYAADMDAWLESGEVPAARMTIGYGRLPFPIGEEEVGTGEKRQRMSLETETVKSVRGGTTYV